MPERLPLLAVLAHGDHELPAHIVADVDDKGRCELLATSDIMAVHDLGALAENPAVAVEAGAVAVQGPAVIAAVTVEGRPEGVFIDADFLAFTQNHALFVMIHGFGALNGNVVKHHGAAQMPLAKAQGLPGIHAGGRDRDLPVVFPLRRWRADVHIGKQRSGDGRTATAIALRPVADGVKTTGTEGDWFGKPVVGTGAVASDGDGTLATVGVGDDGAGRRRKQPARDTVALANLKRRIGDFLGTGSQRAKQHTSKSRPRAFHTRLSFFQRCRHA